MPDTGPAPKEKIVFADQTVVDALRPYVQEVLDCLAEKCRQRGYANAFVTDESRISDFMPQQSAVKAMGAALGVSVERGDYIYEIAIRLRDR
jgi:hypothetical protein